MSTLLPSSAFSDTRQIIHNPQPHPPTSSADPPTSSADVVTEPWELARSFLSKLWMAQVIRIVLFPLITTPQERDHEEQLLIPVPLYYLSWERTMKRKVLEMRLTKRRLPSSSTLLESLIPFQPGIVASVIEKVSVCTAVASFSGIVESDKLVDRSSAPVGERRTWFAPFESHAAGGCRLVASGGLMGRRHFTLRSGFCVANRICVHPFNVNVKKPVVAEAGSGDRDRKWAVEADSSTFSSSIDAAECGFLTAPALPPHRVPLVHPTWAFPSMPIQLSFPSMPK
ncbi:unnamed protein product [Cyprideis torosa]|uniref:Uncharacterized protein n=1 Tax=Cyprideis torosa TaxID=163714 RepID=A0A7R8WB38_9CRUS|nr:unnamed protein product [Cyprideis torosa]CAG0886519.1 unnamed protein product [Cyprideis torosa]